MIRRKKEVHGWSDEECERFGNRLAIACAVVFALICIMVVILT